MKKKIFKKILIVGSNEKFSLENMYLRAFKKLKFNIKLLHIYNIKKNIFSRIFWKYFKFLSFIFIRYKILSFLKNNRNSYDLIVIFKGLYLNKDFIIEGKKLQNNAKWINIYPDDPLNNDISKDISNKGVISSINYFDIFFIWSKVILKKLKKKFPFQKFIYLPFANDSYFYKKQLRRKKKIYDLSFIGTADQKRYNLLKELNEFKIILAGNGWREFNLLKNIKYVGSVNHKKFSKLVNLSKLSLNILRDQNATSHNMKTFEIPAMGGLMITKRTKEQEIFFPDNKACLMYNNINELKIKIRAVLKNPNKFNKIKKNAYSLSKYYTYKKRAKQIIKNLIDDKIY